MNVLPTRGGWVEVVCGSMFSGKSEELIRRLRRAQIARQKVAVYKPALDNRYHATDVASHDGNRLAARAVETPGEILRLSGEAEVVDPPDGAVFPPPGAPGPFAFANRNHLAVVLTEGEWADLSIEPDDRPILLGGGLGMALGSAMTLLLFRVSPYDLRILAAIAAVLAGTAVLACLVPARRAAAVDPMAALRYQ